MSLLLKNVIISMLFLMLTLVQVSFLPHVRVMDTIPNIVFIAFFIIALLERQNEYYAVVWALLAGFMLDVFSSFYFGASMISLLIVYIFLKYMMYFLKEMPGKYLFVYFIPVFLLCQVLYGSLMYVFINFPHITPHINQSIFAGLVYNLALALIIFYAYKQCDNFLNRKRQLTLFQ